MELVTTVRPARSASWRDLRGRASAADRHGLREERDLRGAGGGDALLGLTALGVAIADRQFGARIRL